MLHPVTMDTRAAVLQSVSDAIAAAVALRLNGRMSPEEIERAARAANVDALRLEVAERIGADAARDPWTFYAFGDPRGLARNLVLIYSRACELRGIVPAEVTQ